MVSNSTLQNFVNQKLSPTKDNQKYIYIYIIIFYACMYFRYLYILYIGLFICKPCIWSRKWQSTSIFLPGEFHGHRSVVGYSPQGHKESDTTERLSKAYITSNVYVNSNTPKPQGLQDPLQNPCLLSSSSSFPPHYPIFSSVSSSTQSDLPDLSIPLTQLKSELSRIKNKVQLLA